MKKFLKNILVSIFKALTFKNKTMVDYIAIDTSVSSPTTYIKRPPPHLTFTDDIEEAFSLGDDEEEAQKTIDIYNGSASRYEIGTRPHP